jgi:hypothetical protein
MSFKDQFFYKDNIQKLEKSMMFKKKQYEKSKVD